MSRVVKKPEVRIREILDVAGALFLEKGYVQTTIEDIACAMSVAKGMVYHYFRSKDDIFEAVLEREVQEFAEDVRKKCFDIDGSAIDKLHAFWDYLSELLANDELLFVRLHQNECLPLHNQANLACMRLLLPMLTEVVKQGMAEGIVHVFSPDTAAMLLMNGTFALVLDAKEYLRVARNGDLFAAGRDFYARMLGVEQA